MSEEITNGQCDYSFDFKLDDFQEEALFHINNEKSVVVCAPTGAGKTCIAQMAIHKALKETQIHTFSSFKGGLDELIPSNYILRERMGYLNRSDIKVGENFNGFAMNKQAIINRFSRMKRHYGLKFSLSTLYGSGVIHRGLKNIPLETPKHRVEFLNYLEEVEGVNRGMGYFYYKEFLKMLPRLEKENQEKESE